LLQELQETKKTLILFVPVLQSSAFLVFTKYIVLVNSIFVTVIVTIAIL